ncbi:hypothetical protein FKW77_004643 [Venturia effusa]|uniref:Uncharacterized protein n=1 Tax=Venturia effusa TaxID=50376 RepID=A0A517L790_9PEZI|nr:hypothetical protein FKW77_004643 [Venturia effusa]
MDDNSISYRMKMLTDGSNRNAQLDHLGREQNIKLDAAQAQQSLRLGGISAENQLKYDHQQDILSVRESNGAIDRADMEYKLHHQTEMNIQKADSAQRLEDISRDSQQRKNMLEQSSRLDQLSYQAQSDDRKLYTERGMNDLRRNNLYEANQALRAKYYELDNDRQNQLQFSQMSDRQKLETLQSQGQISNDSLFRKGQIELTNQSEKHRELMQHNRMADQQKLQTLQSQGQISNRTLYEKGAIENNTLRDKHIALQENRSNELHPTARMGQQKIDNERGLGLTKVANERDMGNQRVVNEDNLGDAKHRTQVKTGTA